MDPRRQKGRELADRAQIVATEDGCYLVPSQSGAGHRTVILEPNDAVCDCPDFELRDKACKHIHAVRLWLRRKARGVEQDTEDDTPSPKAKRPTYKQAWKEYNAAQTNERRHFMALLADLCRVIPEPVRKPGPGRPSVPLADAVYSACFKVYSLMSARRFAGNLEEAHEQGHIGHVPHFNSVLNCLDSKEVTPILLDMIRRSSLPLRAVDVDFAVDSTGFATSRFIRYFDIKYGVTKDEAEWVKVHIATGTKTNVVTAIRILDKNAPDCPQFRPLMNETAKNFTINEASADKAYCATECFDTVDAHGGTLFAPFKINATGAAGGVFERMYFYFLYNREEYLKHYGKRSNVESTNSMVKRKFGDSVRSKTDRAQMNECIAKFVCHNICCVIASWYELGIAPEFTTAEVTGEARNILPVPKKHG